jgi:hypothetical protein
MIKCVRSICVTALWWGAATVAHGAASDFRECDERGGPAVARNWLTLGPSTKATV